jgi:hypothetical protein
VGKNKKEDSRLCCAWSSSSSSRQCSSTQTQTHNTNVVSWKDATYFQVFMYKTWK